MMLFLVIATLMTAIALVFILPTLLVTQRGGRSQVLGDQVNLAVLRDQFRELDADLAAGTIDATAHESARRELEQRVAEDVQPKSLAYNANARQRLQAIAVGLVIVIGAASLYSYLGTPAGIDPALVTTPDEKSHDLSQKETEAIVERLAQRLKAEPANAQGWLMLARSYSTMRRYDDASTAYAYLMTLVPDDAQLLTDYADVLAMKQGQSLQGEPEKLLIRALAADPKNTKTLALMGSAAFERGDYAAAIENWQKIVALEPVGSEMGNLAASNIKEAQSAITKKLSSQGEASAVSAPIIPPEKSKTLAVTAAPETQVSGTVELDPGLRSQAAGSDTVFIFARAAEGPRFPLTVLRKHVRDLPLNFVLDDSMSMAPNAKLSGFPLVVVGARISRSGNATPSAGDLEGLTTSVPPGTKNLKIRISAQRE